MRSGLTVVWGCKMLTGSVLATFWGISRIFSAMNPWTAFSASTVPWIKHTRSVVPVDKKVIFRKVSCLYVFQKSCITGYSNDNNVKCRTLNYLEMLQLNKIECIHMLFLNYFFLSFPNCLKKGFWILVEPDNLRNSESTTHSLS